MLAKPSALLALVGLALAQLLVSESWRNRLLYRVAPLCRRDRGGSRSTTSPRPRYVHQGLRTFLQVRREHRLLPDTRRRGAAVRGPRRELVRRRTASRRRFRAALRRPAAGRRAPPHRGFVGVPGVRCSSSWLGPWFAAHQDESLSVRSTRPGCRGRGFGTAALPRVRPHRLTRDSDSGSRGARALRHLGAAVARSPGRSTAPYDARLLAPAWPPLLALVVLAALPAATRLRSSRSARARPARSRSSPSSWRSNVYNIDGLRKSGWDQLRRTRRLARSRPDARDCPARAQPRARDRAGTR